MCSRKVRDARQIENVKTILSYVVVNIAAKPTIRERCDEIKSFMDTFTNPALYVP